jgi:hypothetical protein
LTRVRGTRIETSAGPAGTADVVDKVIAFVEPVPDVPAGTKAGRMALLAHEPTGVPAGQGANTPVREPTMTEPTPQDQLARMITGYWTSQAIYVAARLGLADLLAGGPKSVE